MIIVMTFDFCVDTYFILLQKPLSFYLFTSSNSHALAAPNLKELHSWTSNLDPTRSLS
jgi:kinesin family protein 1